MKHVRFISLLAVMVFSLHCATQEYVPTENEEIYGTWINPQYRIYYRQK